MVDGDIHQIVRAGNDAWNEAFNRGDAAAVAACYTGDAMVLPPTHDVVSGAQQIKDFWSSVIGAGFGRHTIEVIELQRQGDAACAAGRWTAVGKGQDGWEQSYGGSLVNLLVRQPDGSWKSKLHIWN
jgi:uncharacterized protein (TIGR02246 family)